VLRTRHACVAILLASALGPNPHAQSPEAASGYGLLWLDIDSEKAEIALDGAYLDQGVWLISVPPGSHEIRIRKAGYQGYSNRFDISPGQSLHLDVHLAPGGDSLALPPI
jgi:hypothetical protein